MDKMKKKLRSCTTMIYSVIQTQDGRSQSMDDSRCNGRDHNPMSRPSRESRASQVIHRLRKATSCTMIDRGTDFSSRPYAVVEGALLHRVAEGKQNPSMNDVQLKQTVASVRKLKGRADGRTTCTKRSTNQHHLSR